MKSITLPILLFLALTCHATDIVPNPASPGNLGQTGNPFPNAYFGTGVVNQVNFPDGTKLNSANQSGSVSLSQLPAQVVTNQSTLNYLPSTNFAFSQSGNNYLEGIVVKGTNIWMSWRNPSLIQSGYISGTNIVFTATNTLSNLQTVDTLALTYYGGTVYTAACEPAGQPIYTNSAAIGFNPSTLAIVSSNNFVGIPFTNYVQGFCQNPLNGLLYVVDYLYSTNIYVFDSSFNYKTTLKLPLPGLFQAQGITALNDGTMMVSAGGPGAGYLNYSVTTNGVVTQVPLVPPIFVGEQEGCFNDNNVLYTLTRTLPYYLYSYVTAPQSLVDTYSRAKISDVSTPYNAPSVHFSSGVSGISKDPVDNRLLMYVPFSEQVANFGFLDYQSGLLGLAARTGMYTPTGVLGGGGAFFNAANPDYIQFPYLSVNAITNNAFTINLWICKTNGIASNAGAGELLSTIGSWGSSGIGIYALLLIPPSTIELSTPDVTSGITYNADAIDGAITNGAWHMITATFSSPAGSSIYFDGVFLTNSFPKNTITLTPNPNGLAQFGGYPQLNGGFFTGWMDEFKMWSRVLGSNDIASIYNRSGVGLIGVSGASTPAAALTNAPNVFTASSNSFVSAGFSGTVTASSVYATNLFNPVTAPASNAVPYGILGIFPTAGGTNIAIATNLTGFPGVGGGGGNPAAAITNVNNVFTMSNTFGANVTVSGTVAASNSSNQIAGTFTGSGSGLTGIPTAGVPTLLDDYMSIDQQDPYDQSTLILPQINGSYYGVGKLLSASSTAFYFAATRWPAIQWSGLTNQVLCVHIFATNGATVFWTASVRYWTNGLASGSGSGVQQRNFAAGTFQCSAGVTNDYWITATNNWPLATMTNVTMATFYLGAGSPSTNVWVIQGTHIHAQ